MPSSPGPVTATLGEAGQVTISWQDLSTNEAGFSIQQQTQSPSGWQPAGSYTVGAGREQVQVTVLAGIHRFRVIAFNSGGNSPATDWSTPVDSDDPNEPDPLPAAPTNVLVEDTGMRSVNVRWDDASTNETAFEVERDPAFAGGNRTTAANTTLLNDASGLGTFRYRVRANNAAGSSAWSTWAQIVVADAPPAAPTSMIAQDAGNENDVRLSWVDNSDNEERFIFEWQEQVASQWGAVSTLQAAANATVLMHPAGSGTFRYRVAAQNGAGTSAWTEWGTATVISGWSVFTPSADSRVIYVSSSEGNDLNDGLSEATPIATTERARALSRSGYPDWVLLKRGDTFNATLSTASWSRPGRSEAEPSLVSSYGTGPRPIIAPPAGVKGIYVGAAALNHIAFVGLHLRSSGGGSGMSIIGGGNNILIEDCLIEGFKDNINMSGVKTNVRIRRTIVRNAAPPGTSHSQGIYAADVNGLVIEECAFIRNGWGQPDRSDATIYNHNLYIGTGSSNVIIRNNIIARGSSHGLQLRPGGLVEGNVFIENPLAAFVSRGEGQLSQVRGNVVTGLADIRPDAPRGFGIDTIDTWDSIVEENLLVQGGSVGGTGSALTATSDTEAAAATSRYQAMFRNNIVYNWRGEGISVRHTDTTRYDSISFVDNEVVTSAGDYLAFVRAPLDGSPRFNFSGNQYAVMEAAIVRFRIGSTSYDLAGWMAAIGESDARLEMPSYPDPSRNVGAYAQEIGLAPSIDAYLEAVGTRAGGEWPTAYTAEALVGYFRAGFGR